MTRTSPAREGPEDTVAERLRRIVDPSVSERAAEAPRERQSLEEIGRVELQKQRALDKQRSPEAEHQQSRKQRDTDHGLER